MLEGSTIYFGKQCTGGHSNKGTKLWIVIKPFPHMHKMAQRKPQVTQWLTIKIPQRNSQLNGNPSTQWLTVYRETHSIISEHSGRKWHTCLKVKGRLEAVRIIS